MTPARPSLGLTGQLVLILAAFGALPLGASITVGYRAGRAIIHDQAETALRELAARQAVHLATELDRQRLILRTITGQLRASIAMPASSLAGLLTESLPEDGVFDGLRLVDASGTVLASVALRDAAPHWPARAPAADWDTTSLKVHREGERVLAYLIAVPLDGSIPAAWLEGHVRSEDFERLFTMPPHLAGGIESAVLEQTGRPVFVAHGHVLQLAAKFATDAGDSPKVLQGRIAEAPFLIAIQPVENVTWLYVAALPLETALAPLARLRNAALLGAVFLLLLIGLTGVLAARFISTPLRELAAAAQRLGRSGTHEPIRRGGTGEVGTLVEAFNRMARDLQKSRAEIERLHAQDMERAQQLATVGELASAVAHEVRNPLTGVLGALELALKRLPSEDSTRPLLAEADRQLRRIEDTTTQLLRYARPPELREVTIDLNLLAERAARVVETRARAGEISLSVEPFPAPLIARVDPELMVQVLVNLMLNGIEAMSSGGRLTVWVTRHAPEIWIGVRDTGPGVPAEQRGAIFKPFYTTKHQGTGLGLCISQQIVTRHRGSLRYEETPGGGATFVVALPLAREGGDRS